MILHNVDMYSDVTTLAAGGLSWQQTTGNVPLKGTLTLCQHVQSLLVCGLYGREMRGVGGGGVGMLQRHVAT